MHAFIVIMTNKFGTLMVQIPSVTTVKLEPSDNCIFILSSFDEYVCPTLIFLTHHLSNLEVQLLVHPNSMRMCSERSGFHS